MSLASLPPRLFLYLRQHGTRATIHRLRHGIAWRSRRAYWDASANGRRIRQRAYSGRFRQKVSERKARAALGKRTLARAENQLEMLRSQLVDNEPSESDEDQRGDRRIAVVVPAYQAEDFLDACLKSVARSAL